jgi:hypothetical protein
LSSTGNSNCRSTQTNDSNHQCTIVGVFVPGSDVKKGLKGRNITARGNALGKSRKNKSAPQNWGANKHSIQTDAGDSVPPGKLVSGIHSTSRPRTPNDNPFIELFFGTVKTARSWPGRFPANDIESVRDYFEQYFHWYNTRHFHSGIDYLHPADKHAGLEDQIIKEREKQLTNQRNARKMYWLNQQLTGSSL